MKDGLIYGYTSVANEDLESIHTKLAECEKDAERYRWLRDGGDERMAVSVFKNDGDMFDLWGKQLDSAIDEAMKENSDARN